MDSVSCPHEKSLAWLKEEWQVSTPEKKKIVNKKDKQIKEGCYGLLNNLSSG